MQYIENPMTQGMPKPGQVGMAAGMQMGQDAIEDKRVRDLLEQVPEAREVLGPAVADYILGQQGGAHKRMGMAMQHWDKLTQGSIADIGKFMGFAMPEIEKLGQNPDPAKLFFTIGKLGDAYKQQNPKSRLNADTVLKMAQFLVPLMTRGQDQQGPTASEQTQAKKNSYGIRYLNGGFYPEKGAMGQYVKQRINDETSILNALFVTGADPEDSSVQAAMQRAVNRLKVPKKEKDGILKRISDKLKSMIAGGGEEGNFTDAGTSENLIKVEDAEGNLFKLPAEQLEEAEKQGYRRVE